MSWVYDAAGNITQKTDFQGDVTAYQYDSTNRLVAISNTAYVQASYQYDKTGHLISRILSDGARTEYTYDADNKLASLANYAADGSLVKEYVYTRALSGLVSQIDTHTSSGVSTVTYQYSQRHFLTDAKTSQFDETQYNYDSVGNRKSIWLNNNGRMVDAVDFTYDADNRLVEAARTTSNMENGGFFPGGP